MTVICVKLLCSPSLCMRIRTEVKEDDVIRMNDELEEDNDKG